MPETANSREPDYKRRYEREKRARLQAEAIAEQGLWALHRRERHAALLETIARAANGSSSMAEAMQIALAAITEHTGWVCAFVYSPVASGDGSLALSPHWLVHGEGLEQFVEASRAHLFPPARGLPGRVAAAMRPVWIRDVADQRDLPRRDCAMACGLRAGIGFPILVDGQVAAVFEFFAREALEPDDLFLNVLDTIGVQLGRVIERERYQSRLIYDARHDALTGLPNRSYLLERLATRIASVDDGGSTYAVLFLDLDRFKLVNDSLGHRAGDALLIEIATRFGDTMARSGLPYLLARLGGDEFVILVDTVHDLAAAACVAESLLASLATPVLIDGQHFYGSASIGVTCGHFDYTNAGDALRDADIAMYEAKRNGRGRVGLFEPHLHLKAVTRLALETDLRTALRERQFLLHYQPIVSTGSSRPIAFEALIRWQKAPGVLVPPGAFIDLAEETGLIVFIGEFVLREACRALVRWNEHRAESDLISVSVNISARQLQQPDFIRMIQRTLAETGARADTIVIELTESVATADFERTVTTLKAVRAMGIRVSIDDFGTSQSSLNYLGRLDFDTIKIDNSFVQALSDGSEKGRFVRGVLALARKLAVNVVAEGAELKGRMAELEGLGCQFVQGFHVSRPMTETAALQWLKKRYDTNIALIKF